MSLTLEAYKAHCNQFGYWGNTTKNTAIYLAECLELHSLLKNFEICKDAPYRSGGIMGTVNGVKISLFPNFESLEYIVGTSGIAGRCEWTVDSEKTSLPRVLRMILAEARGE